VNPAIKHRIVILISGRGSNMRSLVQACKTEQWNAQIVGILSSHTAAEGLITSANEGILAIVCDHKAFSGRDEFDTALAAEIDKLQPTLVVLAGFMRVLTPAFVQRYEGRLLNIHPSLLPSFPGLHTHEKAIAAGVKLHGATVHFVTAELDHGPVLIQVAVPVLPDDDADTLAARVLAQEHVIYPRAVRWFIEDNLDIQNGKVHTKDGAAQLIGVSV
jgi:phosphoribosylglycinamide formyltransferase 1